MMAALGLFVFMLPTVAYQSLRLEKSWRHPSSSRIGCRPATQFLGPDNEAITLTGVLYPSLTGGRLSLLTLEMMAETGKAWSLLDGAGTIYGLFVIESLSQTKSFFFSDGAARKIEFTIQLKRVDESLADMLGDLSVQLKQMAENAAGQLGDFF